MGQHLKEMLLRYVWKFEVGERAIPMFCFLLQKENGDTMELNKINHTIVKFQLDGENEHV